jgi:nucleoside-diphosphate-sugar epimerase
MKNILLTGGFGYIGSRFLEEFRDTYSFHVIDNQFFDNKNELSNINKTIKDIRDVEISDLHNVDYVIHLSELSNDPLGEVNENLTYSINHEGTKNLLTLCNIANIEKFIYMSSCAVYGKNKNLVTESSKVNPLTTYSKSKILNEEYIINNDFNFETIILRNATVFGYSKNLRLDLVINELVYEALYNSSIILNSDGTPLRPFVHVGDLVRIINLLVNSNNLLDKQIINIGSKNLNYSIKEIALNIADKLDIKDIKYGEKDPDQRSYKVNFSKFESLFPEYNFNFDLDKGIDELIKNYKKHNFDLNVYRLKKIKYLLDENIIDEKLKFI